MHWLIRLWFSINQWMLSLDVLLIRVWDLRVSALPPFQHNLSIISLRLCLNMCTPKLLHPIGRSIVAADLPLGALFRGFRWIRHLTVFSVLGIAFVRSRSHLGFISRQVHLICWIHNGIGLIVCISCALELSFKIDLHITLIAKSLLYFYF